MLDKAERSLLLSCFHDEICLDKLRIDEEIRELRDQRIYLQLKIDVLSKAEDQFHEDIGDLLLQMQLVDMRMEHELPELEDKLKTLELKLELIKHFEPSID